MDIKTIEEMKEHFKQRQTEAQNAYLQTLGALQALDLVAKTLVEEDKETKAKSKQTKSKK